MDKNKRWKEVTALFLISIAVFGVAEDSRGTEQTFNEMQEQMADVLAELAQMGMNSEEIAGQKTESEDVSEQETETENVVINYEGLQCVRRGGKYGYLDKMGRKVLPFVYDNAAPYVEGLAYFCIGEDYGFMDETQMPVFYLDCDSVSNFQDGLAYISVDGKYGYIDQSGEIVIEPVYDDADYFQDGYAEVMKDRKNYLIDEIGQAVIDPGHWEIKRYGDMIGFWDKNQGRSGHIENGEVTYFEENYQFLSFFPEMRWITAILDNDYQRGCGVIDFEGNIKVPFEYRYITYDKDMNVFCVTDREDKEFYLDGEDFSYVDSLENRTVPEDKKIREFGEKYVFDANRYNKLTPRVSDYLEFLDNGTFSMIDFWEHSHEISLSEWDWNDITTRLYDLGQLGKPALYLRHKHEDSATFEGFFAVWGEEVICLVTADYSGGSGGGEFACLWYDCEEDRLLPGRTSHYGGGVFGAGGEVYDLIDGECQKKISWEAFDHAGPEGGPMTTTYYVNGEETTEEKYKEVDKRYSVVEMIR